MSSNFLVFDPTGANAETDAQYLVDANRLSGVVDNTEFYAALANKLFYQTSIMCAALAQSLANKGYVISDANYAALITALSNLLTPADNTGGLIVVAYAASVNFDCSTHSKFQITLTGNCNATFINATVGQELMAIFIQDSTGGRTFIANAQGAVAGSTDPGSVSIQKFVVLADGSIHAVTPVAVS